MDRKYREFLKLIKKRNSTKNKKIIEVIDSKIKMKYEKNSAIMITDSARFTRRTKTLGVVRCLALLREVNDQLRNVIMKNKGKLMKEAVDNLVVRFRTPDDAVKCGIAMNKFLAKRNTKVKGQEKYNICTGIGYGKVLLFDRDFFGHEVNLTSKLGEDAARTDEILITGNAYKHLKNKKKYKSRKVRNYNISGVKIDYYRILYK